MCLWNGDGHKPDYENDHRQCGKRTGIRRGSRTLGSKDVDLIVASQDFADNLSEYKNVIFLKNIMNKAEVKEKLEKYIKEKGE